ncbi:PREDICTED: junctional adhesion molecule B [Nanorana parkeri]|uniref:junctional adhesion molecule B n=1 Tax=Nanorana parkeri TaxID=125878 RepID=UPI000854270F|nr:PREDICTED: junctional adhesion molecule B [Nanorana parkeri]
MSARLFFLGYFVALCCQRSFGVIVESENLDVRELEFGEAILSCRYKLEKDQDVRLEWKKMGPNGEVSFVYFKNALSGDLQTRAEMMSSSIRIKNLTRGDSGKYRCEVSAPRDNKNFHEIIITLNVLVAPSIPVCDIPSSAMSGSAVELKCGEKEGNPASEYRWFKDGLPLDNQNPNSRSVNVTYKVDKTTGTLHFSTVTKQDTGEYYCEASNRIGKSQRCLGKKLQVEDLNWAGIISAAVIVGVLIILCGCGVCYAQRRGYFSGGKSSDRKEGSHMSASQKENDFKHTKSFVI